MLGDGNIVAVGSRIRHIFLFLEGLYGIEGFFWGESIGFVCGDLQCVKGVRQRRMLRYFFCFDFGNNNIAVLYFEFDCLQEFLVEDAPLRIGGQ